MLSKLSDLSLYIGVNTLLLSCFIENKTVQKNFEQDDGSLANMPDGSTLFPDKI